MVSGDLGKDHAARVPGPALPSGSDLDCRQRRPAELGPASGGALEVGPTETDCWRESRPHETESATCGARGVSSDPQALISPPAVRARRAHLAGDSQRAVGGARGTSVGGDPPADLARAGGRAARAPAPPGEAAEAPPRRRRSSRGDDRLLGSPSPAGPADGGGRGDPEADSEPEAPEADGILPEVAAARAREEASSLAGAPRALFPPPGALRLAGPAPWGCLGSATATRGSPTPRRRRSHARL